MEMNYPPLRGQTLEALEERFAKPIRVVRTPWPLWNEACGGTGGGEGIAFGWHILVAGGSGVSKTFTALNIAAEAAMAGEVVTFHSLEMSQDEVTARLLPMISALPAWKMAPGKNFDRSVFREASGAMNGMRGRIHTNEHDIRTLRDVVTGIRRTFEEQRSRVHIIDYLQLAWTDDAESMYKRITEVSHEVRALARELKIVTIGLSQINRAGNSKEKPTKEAMIGSSSLENDADQVVMLDHTRRRPFQTSSGRHGWYGWMELAKNRHGRGSVEIPTAFESETFRMRQRRPDEVQADEMETSKPTLRIAR